MELQTTRQWNDVFYGYNHNLRIAEGEFYDMKNMTGDNFPVLSPRRKRGIYWSSSPSDTRGIDGLIAKDALCHVSNGKFYINQDAVDGFELINDGKPKQLVSMGAYVIILPDKKYINTNNTGDKGSIESVFNSLERGSDVSIELSMAGEGNYTTPYTGPTAPSKESIEQNVSDGKIPLWIDTSQTPNVLKMWSSSTEAWAQVSTTYTKFKATDINKYFEINDGVQISGIVAETAKHLNGTAIIVNKGEDDNGIGYIIIAGLITQNVVQESSEPIEIKRAMPDLDYVVESNNRLWGCKYFERDSNGYPIKALNEIYACKLGDFKNWYSYQGTAADSYAVTVGTDGEFTGATTHLGYPIFFKENCMHKIYGNYPANYQVQTTNCRGVQMGCNKSIATVNEVLYYKSRSGVCAYDGSLPMEVSSALGDEIYNNAVAGVLGNKYYISMSDTNGIYHIFAYDTKRAVWHKEDETRVVQFENCRGDLYFIDYGTNQIFTVGGTGVNMEESDVEWEVVTGTLGTDSPDKKYISRIDVRMLLEIGAKVSFYAEYDSSGEWTHLFNMDGRTLKSFSVPVRPKRCDHMRLKITGKGNVKIYSLCKSIEWGSDK